MYSLDHETATLGFFAWKYARRWLMHALAYGTAVQSQDQLGKDEAGDEKKMVTWKIINARAVSNNNGDDDDEGEKNKFRKIVEQVIKEWNTFGNAASWS